MKTNVIYCGDCKDVLPSEVKPESVDLIYLDPPFFTNKSYEIIWGDKKERRAFDDRWEGGINHFVCWLEERLEVCREVLKQTGSLYLHCDWHANAYLKVAMDKLFGAKNFRNEIIWHYGLGGANRKGGFSRKHDTILFYSKSEDYLFNRLRGGVTPQMKAKYCHEDKKGKFMMSRGKKYYLKGGKPFDDVWDIPTISPKSRERLGYPTQKPELLLERIILSSSNLGDLVLDPFCGCGTAVAVAQKEKRKWIGVDISPIACKVIKRRMGNLEGLVNVEVIGLPQTVEDLREWNPFKFQEYICCLLGGKSSERKTNDLGIDGYILFDRTPIQVKRSPKVGRNVVDNFETAIRRSKKSKGVIVAFSFTRGAYEEAARAKKEGLEISLINVGDLISE